MGVIRVFLPTQYAQILPQADEFSGPEDVPPDSHTHTSWFV